MNLNQGIHLRERDSSDFSWTPSQLIPWSPPAVITTPPPPQTVPGLAAVASVITDAGATARRPAITLSWNAAGVSDARGILWEARLASEAAASLSGSYNNVSSGALRLVAGLLPATAYLVRARPILNRATTWTGWLAVTTPDVRIGSVDLTTDVVGAMEDALEAAGLADASRAAAQAAEAAAVLARNTALAAQAGATASEIAARSSETAAAGSAGAAGASATAAAASGALATTGATEAGNYAAQALDYRNTAARLTGGGVSRNPVFNDWTGSTPLGMQVTLGAGNAISRITSGIRYSSVAQLYGAGTTDGPFLRLNRVTNALDCALSPAGVLIRAEIEYIAGNLANGGAFLRALWVDTASRFEVRELKNYITATTGIVQVVEIYVPRPAGAVPGSASNFAVDFMATSTQGGATRASATFRLHRLDFEEVLSNSQTSIYQQAVADLAGIQSAVIGLRAVAGSGGALLELVATSGPTGSASLARISADNILLEGSVTADFLSVNWLVGGLIQAEYFEVNSLLTVQQGAGLSYGKASVASDETDGIYFGHDGGRFGLAASRTNAGKRQSLKLASSTGLQILNARHFVSGDAVPTQMIYTASTAGIITVPAGTSRMAFDLIGGGGGGGTRQNSGGQSTWGYPGGDTTVEVYDGATLKHSFVSAGGQEGRGINTNGGTVSTHGAAWGSGGKGGLSGTGGFPSQGGWAAAATVTDWIDLSGYATPRIRITLGAGGLPGAGGAGWNTGDPGTPGRVVMSYSAARDVRADVVPLEPTAVGSFVTTTTGAGAFPDLGAGLWILHRNTATTGIGLGYVTLSPGNVVRAYQDGSATLISSQTPTYTGGEASYTVFYVFYAMGSWG
ncbi:hypothetical protein [Pseudogemmobacter bohemicus]|uniref:hypothetical protein n=1 Tax=Pseudogemmobacter bohemicus TaxID=2250708 RepID=UPI0013007168|nr:hypothetical protein [Pseudogemmobacter bohemicus]